jgi:hypothetical protein
MVLKLQSDVNRLLAFKRAILDTFKADREGIEVSGSVLKK